ncbi:MAG: helix-turn-helix domain-containing protein [Candidatus Thermoplasmatota archaeon]|nr:helix-turn-helix domain-containing protein [Candidatus Thermoplasmatota archaeon]
MRKAVIEIRPYIWVKKLQGKMYECIDRIEGREILRLDFERKTKLVIMDIIMKPGMKLSEVRWPKGVEILNILKVDGERYTVLLSVKLLGKKVGAFFKLFDLNVIYDLPYYGTKDLVKIGAIGEMEPLNRLIKLVGLLGKVEKVSFTQATFPDHGLLKVLTEKQKEIMIAARVHGYYKYPRKINSQELSNKLGISKATTVEHLRKAEIRLVDSLLEGYA